MRRYRFVITSGALVLFCIHAAAQTPDTAQRFFKQAQKKFAQGDLASASEDFSRAIEISSRLDSSKKNVTDPTRVQNQFNALDTAENIRVIDPFTAKAYVGRGVVKIRQGFLDDALADFNAALRIDPRLAIAYVNRGVIYRTKKDLDAACADFDRAISINPKGFEAFTNRADVRLDRQDIEGALKDIERA
jgi:tetratricopeptide (TPR) repeat protein